MYEEAASNDCLVISILLRVFADVLPVNDDAFPYSLSF